METNRPPVWVTPLPPVGSGIAQYSSDILRSVSHQWDFEVLSEPGSGASPADGRRSISLRSAQSNSRRIIQIGNSACHPYAYKLAARPGAVLVLHDVVLHHARLAEFVRRGLPGDYIDLMTDLYGAHGSEVAVDVLRGSKIDLTGYALSEDLIDRAACVVVHSKHSRDQVRQLVPDCDVRVIPMGVPLPAMIDKRLARRHLGISDNAFVVASITHVNPMKRLPVVLRAFRQLVKRCPQALLIVAGSVSPSVDLQRNIDLLGLGDHTLLTGYLSDNDASILAQASDVAVNLRYPSTGETSASLLRLLGSGLPVVVTAHGSFLDVPNDAVIHVPVDRFEEETLTEYLYWLATDSNTRRTYGNNARAFIERNHSMADALTGYRDILNDVWDLDLPEVSNVDLHSAVPRLTIRQNQSVEARQVVSSNPVHHEVADALHYLGLTKHDGTIHEAASALGRLELRATDGVTLMASNEVRSIDPELLEILACPVCKVSVRLEDSELICDQCGRHYRIEDGIPIMLVDEPTWTRTNVHTSGTISESR
jgi:glycosyltransferase involved in cell wall biosynthesis/uncharacterized protein YbaR (Trm112 family)